MNILLLVKKKLHGQTIQDEIVEQLDQPDSAIVMKLAGASLGKFHANHADPVIQMLVGRLRRKK
jgi:Mg/Co/Ni transporter MgtE